MRTNVVYAIVKAGGRQEKVAVGDVVEIDKCAGEVGETIEITPVVLVDGDVAKKASAAAKVTAEIVGDAKGPKISILKYKNKTGYRKRGGHRAKHTVVRITGIK